MKGMSSLLDFKTEITNLLSEALDIDNMEILNSIEVPPNPEMGDFAFPCFRLAKTLKKSPVVIASETLEKIVLPEFLDKAEVQSAYINFFVNRSIYSKEVISKVISQPWDYGKDIIGVGKTIVIDYSSPNIAKPFHVGHLRSTVIGNSLYKIYKALGYNCIGINHLGDWGTQFGKLIVAYKKWGSKEAVENLGIEELIKIYVKFHEEAEKTPELNDDARGWFVKMQDGDPEALELWKWFFDISLREFERIYDILNVKFDYFTGESFYNDKMDRVVLELKDKNLLIESEGAMIVNLEEEGMSPCLILRKDGGTLYATRDIAAAIYRKENYDFEKCIYLTALDQNLHFQQWFKVIEKMGYDWADKLVHVPFGLVSLETGKLSSRKGNVILMEELLNAAVDETLKIINGKNPDLPNKEEVCKQVGIGAVIFNDLYNSRIKDVVFSWDKMLNFDGETGPYVQYTLARISSLLRKSEMKIEQETIDFSCLDNSSSLSVCKLIESYPQKIKDAAEKNEPSIVARQLVDLSQSYNKFYHDMPILKEKENIRKARLALSYAVKTVLLSGLTLLGIEAPDQM